MIIQTSTAGGNGATLNPFATLGTAYAPGQSTYTGHIQTQQSQISMNGYGHGASTQSAAVICSREDEQRFLKDLSSKARLDRLKLVREQEKQATRALLAKREAEAKDAQERQAEAERYEEYLRKKREIEELHRLRDLELERQGKAMRDAAQREEAALRDRLEEVQKRERDHQKRRERGRLAEERERNIRDERRQIEEAIKQIERKRQVFEQEQAIARETAARYRETQGSQISDTSSVFPYDISKMSNSKSLIAVAADISTLRQASHLDYTNTRFHVVKHEPERFGQELEKLKKGAYDKAKEEQTKKSIMKAQKENLNRLNQEKAQERGKRALSKEAAKRDKDHFEKEMRKLHLQENLQKITHAEPGVLADHPGAPVTVLQERKEKQKQDKMLKLFEQEVIVKDNRPSHNQDNGHKVKSQSRSRSKSKEKNTSSNLRLRTGPSQQAINVRIAEQSDEEESEEDHQPRNIQVIKAQHQYEQQDRAQTSNEYSMVPPPMMYLPPPSYQDGKPARPLTSPYFNPATGSMLPAQNVQSPFDNARRFDPMLSSSAGGSSAKSPQETLNQRAADYLSGASYQEQFMSKNFMPTQQPSYFNPALSATSTPPHQPVSVEKHNPFFVPLPEHPPQPAPALSNALPQYFNPYIQQAKANQVLDSEDQGIKLTLHIPKEQQPPINSKVDEFLAENHEYLKENEDSELPDDYDSEDEEGGAESSSSGDLLDESSSSMSSMLVSPAATGKKDNLEEIDRIIRQAKEQKRQLQGMASETESSMSESGFDERYLQKYSEMTQNRGDQKVNNRLVDEFLNDNQDFKEGSSSMESSLLTKHSLANSANHSIQNIIGKNLSYLKQSAQQPPKQYSQDQQRTQPFEYSQTTTTQQLPRRDLQGSELSYNYSEMTGNGTGTQIMRQEIHKGGLKLEIAADQGETQTSQKTLAEIFRERKLASMRIAESQQSELQPSHNPPKREKTKEELAEIRKQMMKKRPAKNNIGTTSVSSTEGAGAANSLGTMESGKNLPKNLDLMQRLARGEKAEVSKKDMLKLTSKNYEMLPEVRKKKEEEKKKEEMKERMRQVKELEKQRRELMSSAGSRTGSSRRS